MILRSQRGGPPKKLYLMINDCTVCSSNFMEKAGFPQPFGFHSLICNPTDNRGFQPTLIYSHWSPVRKFKRITLAGMGAKLWFKMNLPVNFSNKNGTSDESIKIMFMNYWLHCPKEIPLSEDHSHADCRQERMEAYTGQHNKEILKQMMLKHEEIFRGQVRELHRLYQVQKLLMDELIKKDLKAPNLNSITAQISPLVLESGTEHIQLDSRMKVWDPVSGSITNGDSLKRPIPGPSNQQILTSDFLGQRPRIGSNPQNIKIHSNNFNRIQSHRSKHNILHFEQPAVEYINDESAYSNEKEIVLRIAGKDDAKEERLPNDCLYHGSETDVQLTLRTGWEQGTKKNGRQTCLNLELGFTEIVRDNAKESRSLICSQGVAIFPTPSLRSEGSNQTIFRNQRGLPNGCDCQINEDIRTELQMFDVEHERSKEERQSIAERPTEENLKPPPWLLEALSLNRL